MNSILKLVDDINRLRDNTPDDSPYVRGLKQGLKQAVDYIKIEFSSFYKQLEAAEQKLLEEIDQLPPEDGYCPYCPDSKLKLEHDERSCFCDKCSSRWDIPQEGDEAWKYWKSKLGDRI